MEDHPHEGLQVEIGPDKICGERGEERFIAGGIRGPEIIDRLDETASEVSRPDPVGDGAGEIRILRSDEPVCEGLAAVLGRVGIERLAV